MNFPEGQETRPEDSLPCQQSAEYMEKLAEKKEAENDKKA